MKIVFRADASIQIGTGHIMRCLTLAHALKQKGAECQFICRNHEGNLIQFVQEKGFQVYVLPHHSDLPADEIKSSQSSSQLAHTEWLGVSQQQDATECIDILREIKPDWLVVDHYAIDAVWESEVQLYRNKLMVIDDLADRHHQCDILLDQTLGRNTADYKDWVSDQCILLCGSQYALLRPDFVSLRLYSLNRRTYNNNNLKHLLITLGGVDKDNITSVVLRSLYSCKLPDDCKITVVMGARAPWLADVQLQASLLPWKTDVRVNIADMAQLMANSDLAIGAAGATSWERCCLGLPTVMLILAENQSLVAKQLEAAGAVKLLLDLKSIKQNISKMINNLILSPEKYSAMSAAASRITDGTGISKVLNQLDTQYECY